MELILITPSRFPSRMAFLRPRAAVSESKDTQEFLTQVVQSITEVNRAHHPEGYVQQWNLSVERQLPAGFGLSAAYVGSKGTHLEQYSQQTNQISDASAGAGGAQFAAAGKSAVTLLQSMPNPFFVNGQALALGCSHDNRRPTAETLPAIHQRGTGRTGIVRQHLSLAADHCPKTIRRSWISTGRLYQLQTDQQH